MKSITISGFQVFAEETTIPLEKLTFLYGPNSAGKSAIEDALFMISEICKAYRKDLPAGYESFYAENYNSLPINLFQKNWRRISENPIEIQSQMEIAFTTDNGKSIKFSYGSANVEYSNWVQYLDPFYFNDDVYKNTEVKIFGQVLTSVVEDEFAIINFNNPGLSMEMPEEILIACKKYPDRFSNDDGLITIHAGVRINSATQGVDFSSAIISDKGDAWQINSDGSKTKLMPTPSDLIKAYDIFAKIFSDLQFEYITCESFQQSIVPASRKTPQPDELVYLLAKQDLSNDFYNFHLTTKGSPEYLCLAKSFINHNAAKNLLNISDIDSFAFDGYEDLFKNVNHSLSDDLFNERGYHLGFDYRTIRGSKTNEDGYENIEAYIVRIFLVDAQGRRYDFIEVGSGLGYLLPVLVSVWMRGDEFDRENPLQNENNTPRPSGILFIQQPELHLHPALQANLGDVFIESSKNSYYSNFIIETHSENILLRLLKRIRQTKLGLVSEEYALKPDDLSILYFNPSPDGTSTVKRLRISESGDFLDRWPRGFFTERDSELFDDGNPFA